MADGRRVQTIQDWKEQRVYIKAMLEHYLYGSIPPLPKKVEDSPNNNASHGNFDPGAELPFGWNAPGVSSIP
jgi:hypothetical protein